MQFLEIKIRKIIFTLSVSIMFSLSSSNNIEKQGEIGANWDTGLNRTSLQKKWQKKGYPPPPLIYTSSGNKRNEEGGPNECIFFFISIFNLLLLTHVKLKKQLLYYILTQITENTQGTGMIASSSTFRPHPGRVTEICSVCRMLYSMVRKY